MCSYNIKIYSTLIISLVASALFLLYFDNLSKHFFDYKAIFCAFIFHNVCPIDFAY